MQLNNLRIVLLLLMLSVVLHACSIKTAYRQLDWLLADMIDDYTSLSEAQEADAEQRIQSFLQWHQFTQLKTYTQDLQQVKQYISAGLNEARIDDVFNRVRQDWDAIKDRAAPEMADMLLTLDENQRKQLFKNLLKQNQEMDEEFKAYSEKEHLERRADKLIDNAESWLGEVNKQQKTILRSWPEKFKALHEERMAFRSKWQASLQAILEEATSSANKRNKLIDLVKTPEAYQSQAHRHKLAYNANQFKGLMLQVEPTLTAQQRRFLMERLDNLIVNFNDLALEKPSK